MEWITLKECYILEPIETKLFIMRNLILCSVRIKKSMISHLTIEQMIVIIVFEDQLQY